MFKKFFSAVVFSCLLFFGVNVCSAGTFQLIHNAEHFSENLKSDEATDESFNTNDGKIRLQFRKLKNASSDKKLHGLVWLEKDRIYDEHFPDVMYGYTFRAIKNTADSKMFFVIQSIERAILLGYSPSSKKFEVYIDSKNYYKENSNSWPIIIPNTNGDLILAFENPSGTVSARYIFTWDNSRQWFAYSNLGTYNYSINKDRQK